MGLTQWTSSALERIGTNVKALYGAGEDEALVEDDPVGDFLSKKEAGILPAEEDEFLTLDQVKSELLEVKDTAPDTREPEPKVVKLLQDSDEREIEDKDEKEEKLFGENEDQIVQTDDEKATDISGITVESSQAVEIHESEEPKELEEPEEVAIESVDVQSAETNDEKPKMTAVETDGNEEEDSVPVEKSQGDGEIDNLLDVFTSEELSENPISILSKDLTDIEIDSLLEDTRQIVEKFKKKQQ
jgi:hypothetical protein